MPGKTLVLIAIILFAALDASGDRIALVVDYPAGDDYTECLSVAEGADAYAVLETSGLDIDWSYYPAFGHGLCGIESVGCPASNCYCSSTEYWNFYTSDEGGTWTYSALGFDGGSSCSEHYCAIDGTLIGLGYGPYGAQPAVYSFSDICCALSGDSKPCGEITLFEVIGAIASWDSGEADIADVMEILNAWMAQA